MRLRKRRGRVKLVAEFIGLSKEIAEKIAIEYMVPGAVAKIREVLADQIKRGEQMLANIDYATRGKHIDELRLEVHSLGDAMRDFKEGLGAKLIGKIEEGKDAPEEKG